ncbi:MAG: hypothetical protein JO252_29920 [Planctomycetaceae bacterium]|nr:hypothetical protein [Planctomycetaceae bacterium]
MVHLCTACAEVCDDCLAVCEPLNDPEMELVSMDPNPYEVTEPEPLRI